MTTNDVTFQESGEMRVFLRNELSGSLRFLDAELVYTPVTEPPKEWSRPEDWQHAEEWSYTENFWSGLLSLSNILYVANRGEEQVERGKGYHFNIALAGEVFGLYLGIFGVEGGSTCRPGYRIRDDDGNWRLVTPPAFDGRWGFRIATKRYIAPIDLSLEYIPYSEDTGSGNPNSFFSRLIFRVSGGGQSSFLKDTSSATDADFDSARIVCPAETYVLQDLAPIGTGGGNLVDGR